MKTLTPLLAGTVAAFLFAGAACGGQSELEDALDSVTEDQLDVMVLPLEAYGTEFADLEVDAEESGPGTAADAADDSFDPDDTAQDFEDAGFIASCELMFTDPSLAALEDGEGVIGVLSGVALFSDEEAASAAVEADLEDARSVVGQEVEPGLTVEEFTEFEVEEVADDAAGAVLHQSFTEADFYTTAVLFSIGRLEAFAAITRADDVDVSAESEAIAATLRDRIEDVVLGEIEETPIPIPEEKQPQGAEAPDEPPFPHKMALSLDDLPEGVEIAREEYVADAISESSYEREFDLAFQPIGNSELISLENDIALYRTQREASGLFATNAAIFTSDRAAEFLAPAFSAGAGFEVSDVTVEDLGISDIGDESFAVRAGFDTPVGRFDGIFAAARVGRSHGLLIITGLAGKVDSADVTDLTDKMAARMTAEMASSR